MQAQATGVDMHSKKVSCMEIYEHEEKGVKMPRNKYSLSFDKLIIATGTKSNTFGVPGICSKEEDLGGASSGTNRHNVFFLKQLEHARAIRNRIIECFERASSSSIHEEEKNRLLTFVVVGGGPTSIEFASELHDFLLHDVTRWYPDLSSSYQVIMVEAGKHLLGTFDESLSNYVEKVFKERKVTLLTGRSVSRVKGNSVELSCGRELEFGVCVWSTGNKALDFVSNLGLPLSRDNRILVDPNLRVGGVSGVYALGDCAVSSERPLAMLAQVANQQGKYLARQLNRGTEEKFKYMFMGSMAQLGT